MQTTDSLIPTTDRHMPTVLVAGSSWPFRTTATRAARMVATTLVENGFNLLTGNATGVDKAVAAAYCFEVARRGEAIQDRYTQLRLPWLQRGSLWPVPAFAPPPEARRPLRTFEHWLEEARTLADAAVMIGVDHGTLVTANRFIDAGKPVFPVPFTGGQSNEVFREVLRNWCDNPVPGLSKSQFLRLAIPWVAGTGALADLLRGTLAPKADIFISYRRADTEWITGRLRRDLAEHFGTKRVFLDVEHIGPGAFWHDVITSAVMASRVGIVVIGAGWFDDAGARLMDESDVLRKEIRILLESGKPLLVVTTPETPPPHRWQLPPDISRLKDIQAVTVTNAGWDLVLDQIIRTIRPFLKVSPQTAHPDDPKSDRR
jgi:TIR domain